MGEIQEHRGTLPSFLSTIEDEHFAITWQTIPITVYTYIDIRVYIYMLYIPISKKPWNIVQDLIGIDSFNLKSDI